MTKFTEEIYAEVREKLMDKDFVAKYGTSASMNMSRDYRKHLADKYDQLSDEFSKINKNPEDGITHDELSQFIREDLGNLRDKNINYSPDYIDKIFDILDVDKDGDITM